ncbi:MAG: hypothetical protein ACOYOS_20445 [Syntrophales bacterium]
MKTLLFEFAIKSLPEKAIKMEKDVKERLILQMATAIREVFKDEGRQKNVNLSEK